MDKLEKNVKLYKMNPKKYNKIRQPVPDLLLSYVYFLNEFKTASIIIGYDSEMFEPKMLLLKGTEYLTLSWDDWHLFYNNISTIQQFFEGDQSEKIAKSVNDKGRKFKLAFTNLEKRLIFTENSSKIKLKTCEWEKLWALAPLLHSIFSWYVLTGKEISSYYTLYLNKCILQNCSKLDYKDFFTPMQENNNYCNYSRLFNELPILSKKKLINDLYSNLCMNAVQENKNI